ncbi:MAG: hypothetical protein EU530_05560 [Promethearchaeota archaeon]|nr:MAG: hypothetical protein EU530_05560 [Candidatus Lokiarchaeota archaeon]
MSSKDPVEEKKTTKKSTKKKTTTKNTSSKEITNESTKKVTGYIGQKVMKGDLIKLDLLGKTVPTAIDNTSVTFQVSNMDDAAKLPNFDPEKSHLYTPELVLVGEKSGSVFEKIGDLLTSGDIKYGEEKNIILDPKDAFGVRDPKNIEKMSYKKFMGIAKEKPRLGMEFRNEKTGKTGQVITVDQGRIRVDFNHPLAGRQVEYRVKPLERMDKFEDKVFAFISRRIPGLEQDKFPLDHNKSTNTLNITTPDFFGLQQGVGMSEFYVAYDLQNNLGLETVNFIHSYKKPPTPAPHDHEHDHDHDHDHDHEDEKVDLGKDDSIAEEIAKPTNKKSTTKKSTTSKKPIKKTTTSKK